VPVFISIATFKLTISLFFLLFDSQSAVILTEAIGFSFIRQGLV
jgi:hypothetical protein